MSRSCVVRCLALIASALVSSGCGSSTTGTRCAPTHAALIPAYVEPDQLAEFAPLSDPSDVIVVNPRNGPGAAMDPAYRGAIGALRGTGAQVVGYVATDYGRRDLRLVRRDIARYAQWYAVRGIFVDEVPTSANALPYYIDLMAGVAHPSGMTVLNPGGVPAPGYFALADVVVTFEGTSQDYLRRSAAADAGHRNVAHLVFGATDREALAAARARRARYVYVSSASLPNPWGRLAPTAAAQLQLLRRC